MDVTLPLLRVITIAVPPITKSQPGLGSPPQLRVHRDQDLHPDQEPGTGPAGNLGPAIMEQLTKLSNLHRLFLQVLVLTGSPLQSSPPFAGAGESQYLV